MNLIIKTLEEIGQNLSVKQFKNSQAMVQQNGYNEKLIMDFSNSSKDFVCILLPEEETDENTDGDEEEISSD